jgi:hypothetical protein
MIGSEIIGKDRGSGDVPSMSGPAKVETPISGSLAGEATDAVVTQTSERSSRPEAAAIHPTDPPNWSGPTTTVARATTLFAGAPTLWLAH